MQWDSYLSLIFPSDPNLWKTDLCPIGGLKAWLELDRKSPLPSYVSQDEKERITKALLGQGGMKAPVLWYNLVTSGLRAKDDGCE
jgi:soluble epoxide hydrolase/lipid-phosphate phosphatase